MLGPLLCALALVAGAAADGSPAPGPASSSPKADLLFILSANTANFTSARRLVLGGLSYTAQFTGQNKAGVYPIGLFTNSSEGAPFTSANGEWLGSPQGVLYGTAADGNMTAVFLDLSNPMYDPQANTATFDVAVTRVPKYRAGAVASAHADATKNIGPSVLTAVNATTELRAAALFIDTNRLALGRVGETKWWGYGGGWGGGWGGYHGGWGGGWGYQPTYYYQPVYYQPYYQPWGGGCGYCGR